MSGIDDDGGPAFPIPAGGSYSDGLSLRDWFAGQALVALMAGNPITSDEDGAFWCHPLISADAYKLADAMLAARKQS